MIRLFESHKIRKQTELDGLWDFQPVIGEDELPKEYSKKLPVPGCWEQHPEFLKYRGLGVFKKNIYVLEKQNIRLEFKGVSHTAKVYFDGNLIAQHYNAYTPFSAVVCEVEPGNHEIVVHVDNRFSEKSALHIGNDYYTYGGITRPVALEKLGDAFIERLEFIPQKAEDTWFAKVKILITGLSNERMTYNVHAKLADRNIDLGQIEVKSGEMAVIEKRIKFDDVMEWSAQQPNLYKFEVNLKSTFDEDIDDLIETVGFRIVKVEGEKLLVNGNEVQLKGFNRHEDFGIVGCSIPFQLMVKDLELLKEMGSNTVRTCHYPNDELFLDLCDEMGFYIWEENHARGLSIEKMQNPYFDKQCEDCNREMVENHINHPSIIMWGILNECASHTQEGSKKYKMQFDQLRTLDNSRPLTFACDKHFKDLCLEYVDIVSLNIYSGWYNEEPIKEFYEREIEWVRNSGGNNKPVILSEFGAAGLYGFRDPARVKWSEERQCDIIEECLNYYMSRPEIVGTLIWQFSDCRVTEENNWFQTRARTHNNKGVVDDYRRPKMAFYTVKSIFNR